MKIEEVVRILASEGFEVVGIKENRIEVKRLNNNGKGYQRIIFDVNSDGIIHNSAYENSSYEMIDVTIKAEDVSEYITEQL
jgi:hypothetical protein